ARPSIIRVTARRECSIPPADSLDHWFKEHQWGFGRSRDGEPLFYEVRHPHWAVHPVESLHLDFDWGSVYGPAWEALTDQKPLSVVLAQGSPIEVHPKRPLKRYRARTMRGGLTNKVNGVIGE